MTNAYAPGRSTAAGGAPARALAARWAPWLHALLRIGAGLLYMEHGLQKLFGMFGGMGPSGGTVPLVSLMGLAGVLESGGGLLLVLGLFTRPVAAVLVLEMLYAFATVHLPQGGAPIQNHGELPLLYALIWAFLAGNGAGPASLDSRRAG
ncbi:MAG: DoxX family protein [Gemmatimonadales bacterium]